MDIHTALRDYYDLIERAMIPGVLIGDAAYQMKMEGKDGFDHPLEVSELEWAMPKNNLTPEVKSLFKTWGFTETETGYEYTISNVPVKIRVYQEKYSFFEQPDQLFYAADEYYIPNPFETYWKERGWLK